MVLHLLPASAISVEEPFWKKQTTHMDPALDHPVEGRRHTEEETEETRKVLRMEPQHHFLEVITLELSLSSRMNLLVNLFETSRFSLSSQFVWKRANF
jgi:hypothetical protein